MNGKDLTAVTHLTDTMFSTAESKQSYQDPTKDTVISQSQRNE